MSDFSQREAPIVSQLLYDNPAKAAERLREDFQLAQSPQEAAALIRQVTQWQDPQGLGTLVVGRPQPTDGMYGSATTDVVVQSYDQYQQPVQELVARLESSLPAQTDVPQIPLGTDAVPGLSFAIGPDGQLQYIPQGYPPGYGPRGYAYDQGYYSPGYDSGYIDPLAAMSGLFILGAAGYGISRWGHNDWLYRQERFSDFYRQQAMVQNPGQLYGNQRITMPVQSYNTQITQPWNQHNSQIGNGGINNGGTFHNFNNGTGGTATGNPSRSFGGGHEWRYLNPSGPNGGNASSTVIIDNHGNGSWNRNGTPGQIIAQPGSNGWQRPPRETAPLPGNGQSTTNGWPRETGPRMGTVPPQGGQEVPTGPRPGMPNGQSRQFGNSGPNDHRFDRQFGNGAPADNRQFGNGAPQPGDNRQFPPPRPPVHAPDVQTGVVPTPAPRQQFHGPDVQRTAPPQPEAPRQQFHAPDVQRTVAPQPVAPRPQFHAPEVQKAPPPPPAPPRPVEVHRAPPPPPQIAKPAPAPQPHVEVPKVVPPQPAQPQHH